LYLARALRDLFPDSTPAADLTPAVFGWWALALGVIGTKPWADTWRDFRRAWRRAAVPVSASRPVRVMAGAAADAGDDPTARLVAACEAMGRSTGGTFHLSCRTAAQVAGVSRATAARWLKELAGSGVLELVTPGTPSGRKRRAAVYRLRALTG
jgi:hypothetical protein